MKKLALLISQKAKSAYFSEYIDVAKAELAFIIDDENIHHNRVGAMDFLEIDIDDEKISALARLSFVHGIFQRDQEKLMPLPLDQGFNLHEDFVFGSKFKGKTNEILTQLLINVGLKSIGGPNPKEIKLLDPMCGKATTLIWAMRYGIKGKGIELDPNALDQVRQILKKWSKVHRQKHDLKESFLGGKQDRKNSGKLIDFKAENTEMRIISGDTKNTLKLLKSEKYNLIISDLPYGVSHFTTKNTRNPIDTLRACAHDWCESLRPGGVIVLSFNNYLPKRKDLLEVFLEEEMTEVDFNAQHRMSESILRDVLVLKK